MHDVALFGYPLTEGFRKRLEASLGGRPEYLSLTDLRRLPMTSLARRLRSLSGSRMLLVMESEGSRAALPALICMAALTRIPRIEIVSPTLERSPISRWQALSELAGIAWSTLSGQWDVQRCRQEAAALLQTPRIADPPELATGVLYLKTNMSFGVTAGGMVGHIAGVTNSLLASGRAVDFFSTEAPLLVDPEVRYFPIAPLASYGLPYESNLIRFQRSCVRQMRSCRRDGYGFLYQRMSIGNYAGVVLSREFGLPLVLEYNGSEVWCSQNWGNGSRYQALCMDIENACLKHAHLVVTISDVLRDELIGRGVEPDRVVSHPNCVDPRSFDPSQFSAEESAALRGRWGISADSCVAGFVGTFGQWHGVEKLAEAIRRLVDADADWLTRNKVRFLIVGDGRGMPAVRDAIGAERYRPFVTLTGLVPQAEAAGYLAACDFLLSPHVPNADGTRFFGSPTKLFEYMAMGKAVAASDLEQIGEVLRPAIFADNLPKADPAPGQTERGLLLEPANVDQLIASIRFLIERPRWRQTLGENARRAILAQYTWDRHAAAILNGLARLRPQAAAAETPFRQRAA